MLDISPMSNTCAKCSADKPHPPELCPKNVDCTAKAMEAIGSADIVHKVFKNYPAYICEYVGDDDSSTKKVLRHSWQDEVDHGLREEKDFPRNKDGRKKPDNGLLPIDHPAIIWLADKGHSRVRQFAKKLYKLSRMKKADCECTSMDAERLKRNLSYAIRTNCRSGSLPIMKAAVNQVLEHHFNNHEECGEWCKLKPLTGEALATAKLNYRCKVKNEKFYLQVKELFTEFDLLLEEMLHEWDTNIVEGMNKFFCKFLPKDRTYAMTIENKVRLYLAIAIDSIGYMETYQRLADSAGFTLCKVQHDLNTQLDKEKEWRRTYRKKNASKVRRMRKKYQRHSEAKRKLANENRKNLTYSTGQCGPFAADQQPGPAKKKRKKNAQERQAIVCSHCLLRGHSRRNHSDCLKNKNGLAQAKKTAAEAREKGKYQRYSCDMYLSMYASTLHTYSHVSSFYRKRNRRIGIRFGHRKSGNFERTRGLFCSRIGKNSLARDGVI